MKKLVIIGGGFAGSYCARKLEKRFETVLIDEKDYFEFTPSILRTIVEPKHIKKIQVLHNHYLIFTKIIMGCVNEILNDCVLVNGKTIYFDYLVIASGSSYAHPIKESNMIKATRTQELRDCYNNLRYAGNVAIVGGGLVGVELAGEIISKYPSKKITIIQSSEKLITRNHPKSISYVEKYFKNKKIKIIYGEKVTKQMEGKIITSSGKEIEVDLVFLCTGIISNYEFMKKNFSRYLNEKNQVKTNEFLQLQENGNIFVAGDVTNISEEKTAQTAEKHASVIVKNICNLEKKKNLCKYVSQEKPMIISLGKYDGIFEYKKLIITGIIPAIMKRYVEWKTMRRYKL